MNPECIVAEIFLIVKSLYAVDVRICLVEVLLLELFIDLSFSGNIVYIVGIVYSTKETGLK